MSKMSTELSHLRPDGGSRDASVSPLRHLDVTAIDAAAKSESRNREVHLPPISVYRWWARRTVAVNGAILDAVARDRIGRLLVADVFAGGGVIPLAAATRGHRVYAQDLNPWAARGLHAMLNLPSANSMSMAFEELRESMRALLQSAYGTVLHDGRQASISHTFRVVAVGCPSCGTELRLYPHAVVSLEKRKERGRTEAFLACPRGHLFRGRSVDTQVCPDCGVDTDPRVSYTRRRQLNCPSCQYDCKLEELANQDSWEWKVVLVERTCGRNRLLDFPTANEVLQAESGWSPIRSFPRITRGRETAVLCRHGFRHWHDLYPERQRHVLEKLLETIDQSGFEEPVSEALRLAGLGVAEMAGLASRWDRWYLKSYESMAAHRFNFTTFSAEPNVWGTVASGRKRSAGWGRACGLSRGGAGWPA